jgi:hypothetical protein
MKRVLLTLAASVVFSATVGCSEDINKNVPKTLPPGAKPFGTGNKAQGNGMKELPPQSVIK